MRIRAGIYHDLVIPSDIVALLLVEYVLYFQRASQPVLQETALQFYINRRVCMRLDIIYFSLEVLFIIYRQTEIAWQVENIGEIQTYQWLSGPILFSTECISVEVLIA